MHGHEQQIVRSDDGFYNPSRPSGHNNTEGYVLFTLRMYLFSRLVYKTGGKYRIPLLSKYCRTFYAYNRSYVRDIQ